MFIQILKGGLWDEEVECELKSGVQRCNHFYFFLANTLRNVQLNLVILFWKKFIKNPPLSATVAEIISECHSISLTMVLRQGLNPAVSTCGA